MSASIVLPQVIRVGAGASAELAGTLDSLGLSRPLLVTDPFIAEQPFFHRLLAGLEASGLAPGVFADTVPDPTTAVVEEGVRALREGGFDSLVGVGGGSPIDTAKAVALLGAHGGRMRDYRAPVVTDAPALPVVAVPTTAGSGSECTRYSIITDSDSGEKMLCSGLAMLPRAALVDFELTLGMPRRLTADTGVDALTHAIEAYVSARANPVSDGFAREAMRTIFTHLRTAYADPGDRTAREAVMVGATQAGMAFSNSSVALVHGMSRPLGAHFGVAHGLSNAMLLPAVTEFSIPSAPSRYADCARAMGLAAPDSTDGEATGALVWELRLLNQELEVPTPREYGIGVERWWELAPLMAEQALASGSPGNNPRVPVAEEIVELYHGVYG
ncbi:iron-containing alcohol dehydrogenase [Nocardiopsis sp. L17-MgMaSL7]|uniref:iron-containing alcohol dehydrogenase n=1 Tax=Nocardiopsis sp. L17-MgMaSL7 TaxID=1938893 RepID=UPI000D70A4F3|nr:iron-containing alcohol dehydrogenase [Nocardiopsis sp. L17-MgMaSL7]PWV54775.1 alcohol dehydrogenase class IV [Nocardiopsis sp. L17-MgMaSL7]